MPQFKCTNCGATASSKCPNRRSVFIEQEFASIYNMVLPATAKKIEDNLYDVALMPKCINATNKTEAFIKALAVCAALNEKPETAKIWACERHQWVRTSPGDNCGAGEVDKCNCRRAE